MSHSGPSPGRLAMRRAQREKAASSPTSEAKGQAGDGHWALGGGDKRVSISRKEDEPREDRPGQSRPH